MVKPETHLVSLEICAGAGGQALGLHDAGFRAVAMYERDKDAAATLSKYAFSLEDRVHQDDIRKVDFSKYRGRVDLVAGGVPCQAFSSAGKQLGKDDERDLFLEAVRVVTEVQPRAFFFENVEPFGQRQFADYRRELIAHFEKLGYESRVFNFYGSDFGLAQLRPRIAFVGFRDGGIAHFSMPPIIPNFNSTLAETIGDLVGANGWKGLEDWKKIAARIAPTIVGGSERAGRSSFCVNYRADAWRELGIDPESLADDAPSEDHKGLFKLTMRMGARIQNFPDEYQFEGKLKAQKRQIANALPPVMAKAVGLAIYSALTGTQFDYEAALRQKISVPVRRGTQRPGAPRIDLNGPVALVQDRMDERMFFGEAVYAPNLDAYDDYPDYEEQLALRSKVSADG